MSFYIFIFVFGALIGSFLNVCIYRIPRNQSIIWPSSRCPSCNNPINFYDNIPIFSYYLLLRGRCRSCKEKISGRYPFVEALNAFFYLLVFWRFGPGWSSAVYCILCSALIVITFIDLDFQIIPGQDYAARNPAWSYRGLISCCPIPFSGQRPLDTRPP